MSALLSIVPWWERLAAIAALCAALFGFGWLKGAEHGERKLDAIQAAALKEGARIVTVRGAVTTKVETKYVPQIAKAQVITETIVKEVPVYVYPTDPDLPGRFRVFHDAAAAGRVPDPAGIPDAAAAPAQDVASTVADNYGTCLENAKQLEGLQAWINEQQRLSPRPDRP